MRELYENEWFPKVNAMGVSWDEFWRMNPRIVNLLVKGHEEKIKETDYLAWAFGQYVSSATYVAVEHALQGKKAKSKYVDKPIFQDIFGETNENGNIESKEEVAIFEMKQRIRLLEKSGLPESPI